VNLGGGCREWCCGNFLLCLLATEFRLPRYDVETLLSQLRIDALYLEDKTML